MIRRPIVALVILLAACGDDGGGGNPDAPPPPDADTTICAGKPCLTSIDDTADWAFVSAPLGGERCDFSEDTKYIAPATSAAALQEVVFHDVKAHRYHIDFMTQELPQYFGGLSPEMYQAIIQRRATRQYWAGAVFRLVDIGGATIGYGFDVIVDPTQWEEELTEAEVAGIKAQLEARFHLPLVYAPTTQEAIYAAYGFETVESHFPRSCWITQCDTPGVDCVEIPSTVPLCGHFMEGRTIEAEHTWKGRLTAVAGTYDLPRGAGTHTVPAMFGAGELGPTRTPITPIGTTATYTVTQVGQYWTRDYAQRFRVGSGTQQFELTWGIQLPENGGGFLLEEPHVGGHFWAQGGIVGSTQWEDRVQFSSCTAESFDHWRIVGTMAGGDGFTIDFQYEIPGAGSGPLFVTRGQVTLGGQTATVTDYFDLVYAGQHHNWNNQYWVLFDAPLTYQGHPIHGLWLDEMPYQFMLEEAHTLDAQLQPRDLLDVTTYVVEEVP